MKNSKSKINYIELFSGIGAFTQAIDNLDYIDSTCLFAADINEDCAKVYKKNYGIDSLCDLTKQDEKEILPHDLCFFSPPCQAFSKAGYRLGYQEARGTLIYEVFRILKEHHPKYILMENVRNLVSHDNGNTIKVILDALHDLGYRTTRLPLILSPHNFGIPQTRERAFLPGIYDPDNVEKPLEIKFSNLISKEDCSLNAIIDHSFDNDENLKITAKEEYILSAWDDFYKNIDIKVIGFPIWVDYFQKSPDLTLPKWKSDFIIKNNELYQRNKIFIDRWLRNYDVFNTFTPTQRKFEWQAGERIKSLWDGVIQFRPSGVRVKAPTTLPALVAMVQIPVIGSLKRRLSVRECANLQSFSKDFICDEKQHEAYKQFGNSINVTVLEKVLDALLQYKD